MGGVALDKGVIVCEQNKRVAVLSDQTETATQISTPQKRTTLIIRVCAEKFNRIGVYHYEKRFREEYRSIQKEIL